MESEIVRPTKFLLAKRPDAVYFHWHEESGDCAHLPTLVPNIQSSVVILYFEGIRGAKEAYIKMKERGLILYETEDQETAVMLQTQIIEEAQNAGEANNPDHPQ